MCIDLWWLSFAKFANSVRFLQPWRPRHISAINFVVAFSRIGNQVSLGLIVQVNNEYLKSRLRPLARRRVNDALAVRRDGALQGCLRRPNCLPLTAIRVHYYHSFFAYTDNLAAV